VSISSDVWIIVFGLLTAIGLIGPYLFFDIRFALSLTILILAWWVDVLLKKMFFDDLGYTFLADLSLAAFSFALSYVFALAALDPIVTMLKDISPSDLPQIEVLLSGNVYSLTYATGFTVIVGFVWLLNLVLSRTLASPQLKTHPRLRVGVWVLAGSLTVMALILALYPQLVNLS
jgi:hypothetical protein